MKSKVWHVKKLNWSRSLWLNPESIDQKKAKKSISRPVQINRGLNPGTQKLFKKST